MTPELLGDYRLLRAALLGDSMLDGAMGLACIVAAGPVAALLGLEAENATLRLRVLGIILVASGAVLLWTGAQHRVSRRMTGAIIALNGLWVLLSLILAFGPLLALTDAGRVVVVGQAALVALLTACELYCLRANRTASSTG